MFFIYPVIVGFFLPFALDQWFSTKVYEKFQGVYAKKFTVYKSKNFLFSINKKESTKKK